MIELYNKMTKDGLISMSFEQFKIQFNNEKGSGLLHEKMQKDGLYSADVATFRSQMGFDYAPTQGGGSQTISANLTDNVEADVVASGAHINEGFWDNTTPGDFGNQWELPAFSVHSNNPSDYEMGPNGLWRNKTSGVEIKQSHPIARALTEQQKTLDAMVSQKREDEEDGFQQAEIDIDNYWQEEGAPSIDEYEVLSAGFKDGVEVFQVWHKGDQEFKTEEDPTHGQAVKNLLKQREIEIAKAAKGKKEAKEALPKLSTFTQKLQSADYKEAEAELQLEYKRFGFDVKIFQAGVYRKIRITKGDVTEDFFASESGLAAADAFMQANVEESRVIGRALVEDAAVTDDEMLVLEDDANNELTNFRESEESVNAITPEDEEAERLLRKQYGLSYDPGVDDESKEEFIQWKIENDDIVSASEIRSDYENNHNEVKDQVDDYKRLFAIERYIKQAGITDASEIARLRKLSVDEFAGESINIETESGFTTIGLDTVYNDISNDDAEVNAAATAAVVQQKEDALFYDKVAQEVKDMDYSAFTEGEVQALAREEVDSYYADLSKEEKEKAKSLKLVNTRLIDNRTRLTSAIEARDSLIEEMNAIASGEYKTQAEVDKAQKAIDALKKKYDAVGEEIQRRLNTNSLLIRSSQSMDKDIAELGLDTRALEFYSKGVNLNVAPAVRLGWSLGSAGVDLAQGGVEFLGMGYDAALELDSLIYKAVGYGDGTVEAWAQGQKDNSFFGQESRNSFHGVIDQWQKGVESGLAPPQQFDEIGSFGDFGMWFGNMFASQVPNLALMATTGGASLYIMGATSAGSKYKDLREQSEEYKRSGGLYGNDYSFAQMFTTSILVGSAEALSEKITLGQIKNAKAMWKGLTKEGLQEAIQPGVKNFLAKNVFNKKTMWKSGVDMLEEGGSEALATIADNITAYYILGDKEAHLFDGVPESFVSGALISKTIGTFGLAGQAVNTFQDPGKSNEKAAYRDRNTTLMYSIAKAESEGKTEVDGVSIEDLKVEMVENQVKLDEIVELDIKRVDSMTPAERKEMIDMQIQEQKDRLEVATLTEENSKLSPEQKQNKINEIVQRQKERRKKRQDIIDKYPHEDVEAAYKETMDRATKKAELARKAGRNIEIEEGNTEDAAAFVAEMEAQGFKVDASQKEGNYYGVTAEMEVKDPKTGKKEKVTRIFVNKSLAIQDNMTRTIVHEFMHATLYKTVMQDPGVRQVLGQELKNILKDPSVTISKEAQKDLERLDLYSPEEVGEELFAIVSEHLATGEITINDKAANKFKDLINRILRSMGMSDFFETQKAGSKFEGRFDTTDDVREFLAAYAKNSRGEGTGTADAAIEKMLAVESQGELIDQGRKLGEKIKAAEGKSEHRKQSDFSKARDNYIKNNPKQAKENKKRFDDLTQKEDGSKRWESKEDWDVSSEKWDGFSLLDNSNEFMDNLIMSGMASDYGVIRSEQDKRDFIKATKEELQDRYHGGLKKTARNKLDKVKEKLATKEITPAEAAKQIEAIENDNSNYRRGFDPTEANGSLFGWLTGGSGNVTESTLYRARGDVMKAWKADPNRGILSLDAPIGEQGETFGSRLEGKADTSAGLDADTQVDPDSLTKVVNELNVDSKGKTSIKQAVVDASLNLEGIQYKDVKKLTTGKDAPLSDVLNVIAEKFGIDPKRIIKPSDLNGKQRKAAQSFINNNAAFLLEMLPEGETVSGEATGVANTKLGELYEKGERLKFKDGATAAGKFSQQKRSDITVEQFKELFGIKPDGTFDNNRKHDGAIKALVNQATVLAANQALRESAIESGEFSEAVVAALGEGRAQTMFSKRPIKYSPKDQSVMADYIRKYGTSEGEMLKVLYPEITELVEDFAITNILQVDAGGYNSQIFNDNNTPEGLKDLFELRGKKQVIYRGPRLFDVADNGRGILNKTGKTYAKQVSNIGATFHPNVDSKMLLPILGIKNSGKYDGDTWSTRSVHPEAIPKEVNKIKSRSLSKSEIAAEEKLLKDNKIDLADLKLAQSMIMKGRVADIFYEIHAQPTLELKKQKLEEYREELEDINRGNRALLKYTVLKLEQASRQGNLDPITMYHLGAMQTNIVEGLRSLSTFEYMYLTEGKQYPVVKGARSGKFGLLKRPGLKGRSVKEFLESDDWSNYNKEWEDTVDYNETYSANISSPQVKSYAERNGVSVELAAQDITIKELVVKNEHVGASATTNAEINVFVNSAGANMNINDIGNHHRSFFGPKFLMNRYLDAKIPINGMLVDNKVSFEGDLRLTKFAGKRRNDIFHVSGVDVSQYVVENKDTIEEVRNNYIPEINDRVGILEPMQGAMSMSKRAPKPKGISVLDFDDTLATTKSSVLYTAPDSTTGKLNAEEFAKRGSTLLAQGYEFDFSEFNKVVDGKTAPLFNKALKLAKKFGTDNMFILTARSPESQVAIKEFLDSQGLNIPIENITGLGKSEAEAKALWIASKVREGYNDFYFADDAIQNVDAVRAMLDQFDVKSKVQQAKVEFSKRAPKEMDAIIDEGAVDLDSDLNIILEESKGVGRQKRFSPAKARKRGKNKGKFKFFIPPSADDFAGLMYAFMGKGEIGNKHHQWFKENLFDPFSKGIRNLNMVKQNVANGMKELRKAMPEVRKKLGTKINNTEYTYEDAARVYNWDKAGFDIPGLSETDKAALIKAVNADANLKAFADGVDAISNMPGGLTQPGDHWLGGTMASDMTDALENTRATFLQQWKDNVEIIFNEANMNKIEAVYGSNFREALEDMLYRMEYGGNTSRGGGRLLNNFTSWIHGSIGTTMFFNARSAVLQMISNVNFVNWSDNNMLKAATAFANQPQYWKDVSMIFNSPFLKQRRAGLQTDVNAAELLAQIKDSKNKMKAATAYLLQLGFTPTQIADSLAIATGGATFYRNRTNTYVEQGMSQSEAETKAFEDMMELAEETQQSAREDRISQQQASPLGKFILAFQNTPMQYNRLIKKAAMDLVNGRGDAKANVSRIIYYGAVQNMIFYGLQQALFAAMFGSDEEDELTDKKKERVINGMMDTLLRGSGIGGAVVSTLKNVIIKAAKEAEKMDDDEFFTDPDWGNVVIEVLNLSPPIGIKARKIYSGLKTWEYNNDVIEHMSKTDLDNPIYDAVFSGTEAVTNLPLSRLYNKYQNISEAMNADHETWQRVAMLLGWSKWSFGIKNQDVMTAKGEVKELKEEEKKERREIKKQEREAEKAAEEAAIEQGFIDDQEKEREEGKEDITCAAVNKSGKRCGTKVKGNGNYCTIHESVPQQANEVQCSHVKTNGDRCKMKTKNQSGKCYYHD